MARPRATAVKTATERSPFRLTGETDATSAWPATACWSFAILGSSAPVAGLVSCAAIRSGPFEPFPNEEVMRSYARRAVVEFDSEPTSCWPSVSVRAGNARGIRIASATTTAITGCPVTTRPMWYHVLCSGSLRARSRPITRSASRRGPSTESRAGRSVTAAHTAVSTAIADVKPSNVTSGMSAIASEQIAITTVVPAKTTAAPSVATARATDSGYSMPARTCSR